MHIKQLIIPMVALSLNGVALHTSASEFPVPDQPGATFNFYDYRLPEGPLRSFLRRNLRSLGDVSKLPSFKNLSRHGQVGIVSGQTFPGSHGGVFIKAALVDSYFPDDVYSHKQNISRLPTSLDISSCIQKKNLTCFALSPRKYIYPLSGDDNDLKKSDISDFNAVILSQEAPLVSKNTLTIEALRQMKVLIEELGQKVVDIGNPENLEYCSDGKLMFLDTENLYTDIAEDALQKKASFREGLKSLACTAKQLAYSIHAISPSRQQTQLELNTFADQCNIESAQIEEEVTTDLANQGITDPGGYFRELMEKQRICTKRLYLKYHDEQSVECSSKQQRVNAPIDSFCFCVLLAKISCGIGVTAIAVGAILGAVWWWKKKYKANQSNIPAKSQDFCGIQPVIELA